MARIREALRRTKALRGQPREPVPVPHVCEPMDVPCRTEPEPEDEVPFIEVGGRETPTEASSSVLASVPKARRSRPAVELAQPDPPFHGNAAPASQGQLGRIAFQPYVPEPSSLPPDPERRAPELVTLHQPNHPLSAQYRALVKELGRQLPVQQSQVLLFTASTPQADTAAVLLNLAITRVRQDATRDIVVDANLRRPALADRLGLPPTPGLGDVLAGKVPLPRALQETDQANLYALTAGKDAHETIARVAGEPMRAVLRRLQNRFGWIFLHAPCWDGAPELSALLSSCHAVYVVVPEAEAHTATMDRLRQLIVQQGGSLKGHFLV